MNKIQVPATSANIGPGFDCLGVALELYNELEFGRLKHGVEIISKHISNPPEKNLIYFSYLKTLEYIGVPNIPVRIVERSRIPSSRGLGSSAACIVGGVMGAMVMADVELSKEEMLKIATMIEGHPDNVAPAIYGGFTASTMKDGGIYTTGIKTAESIKFLALVPDFKLSTKLARSVLPKEISYSDGTFNVSRVALLISSLVNGENANLKIALEDRLHQPYRGDLIKDFDNIMNFLNKSDAVGAYLSGAGPTIMSLLDVEDDTTKEKIAGYLSTLNSKWEIFELSLDKIGAKVLRRD